MKQFIVADDFDLFKSTTFNFERGLTCLVGKNGTGKSTLLRSLKHHLQKEEKHFLSYDNYTQGGANAMSKYGFTGKMDLLAAAFCSSEGQQIMLNYGQELAKIGTYIRSALKDGVTELYILLDALDSGLSIDNIRQIKSVFELILGEDANADIYIIVAANTFELVKDADCVAVSTAEHVKFADYDAYAQFICGKQKRKRKASGLT